MEERNCFHDFVSALCCRPHVAENILVRLDVIDIVNCLRTCKGFRRLLSSTLGQSKRLRDLVDGRVSVTCGTVDSRHYRPLLLPSDMKYPSLYEDISFGFGGCLWLNAKVVIHTAEYRFVTPYLVIYNLHNTSRNMTVKLQLGSHDYR